MDESRAAQLLELAVKDAIARLVDQGNEVSPTIVGSVAAGIAGALGLGAPSVDRTRGVRFVTAASPALGWSIPSRSSSPLAPVFAPDPAGPQPRGPVPIGPHPGHPNPGGPQPIGPHPGHPNPGGPQPIGPHPGHPNPGGPQPVGPAPGAPAPHGPQPGGSFAPLDPQSIDPAFIDNIRDKFGVVVFENVFKLEVANYLGELVKKQRQGMVSQVRGSQEQRNSAGFKFLGLPQTPEYVRSIFNPLLRDMIEFAANRFKLKVPRRYSLDMRVMVTPPDGGSVAYVDAQEPGGKDRQITWIYCVASSEAYRGGALVLYEAHEPSQLQTRLTRRITVPATANALIMFPSALVHEITPVVAVHSAVTTRPTVQGWLRWSQ